MRRLRLEGGLSCRTRRAFGHCMDWRDARPQALAVDQKASAG